MSLEIFDWVEWSDPIFTNKDYRILQEKHWQRSDIPPEKDRLRLILAPFDLQDIESEYFWVLYTPALSSLNGLYEFPNEIDDCWFVKCKLNQIACELKEMYCEQKFWYKAQFNRVCKLTDFDKLIKPESFSFQGHNLQDFSNYSRPQFFLYDRWLWIMFDDQSYAGFDLLLEQSERGLILIYFREWIDKETKSLITNYKLNEEEINLVADWKAKGLIHNFPQEN